LRGTAPRSIKKDGIKSQLGAGRTHGVFKYPVLSLCAGLTSIMAKTLFIFFSQMTEVYCLCMEAVVKRVNTSNRYEIVKNMFGGI
jgi:hypothetical protein